MSNLETMSDAELRAEARKLKGEIKTRRERRIAIDREIAFRDNVKAHAAAIERLAGLTPEQIARLKAKTQTVAPAGVESAEQVGNVGG